MRLQLTNFRCFSKLDLTLPNDGTVILWGNSGIGKTSIFKAINFVLYGQEKKVVKHGEKRTQVDLHIDIFNLSLHLTRKTNSSHFVLVKKDLSTGLETQYEDDSAQIEIDKLFGKDFLLTSYMSQKGVESFFSLSNNEKSIFLQKLALKDFDVDELRSRVRVILRTRKDKLIAKQTESKLLKEQLGEDDSQQTEPSLKLDMKGRSLEDFIEHENKLKTKNKNALSKTRTSLQTVYDKQKSLGEKTKTKAVWSSILENNKKSLDQLVQNNNIHSIPQKIDRIQIIKKEITNFTSIQKLIKARTEFKDLKAEFEKVRQDEYDRRETDLQTTTEKVEELLQNKMEEDEVKRLEIAKSKIEQLLEVVEEFVEDFDDEIYKTKMVKDLKEVLSEIEEDYVQDIKKFREMLQSTELKLKEKNEELFNLVKEIEGIVKNVQNITCLLSKKTSQAHKCPSCQTKFYIDNNKVVKLDEDPMLLKEQLASLETISIKKKAEHELLTSSIQKIEQNIKKINSSINESESELKKIRMAVCVDEEETLSPWDSRVSPVRSLLNSKSYNDVLQIVRKQKEIEHEIKKLLEHKKELQRVMDDPVGNIPYLKSMKTKLVSLKETYEKLATACELLFKDNDFNMSYSLEECEEQVARLNKELVIEEISVKDLKLIKEQVEDLEEEISDLTEKINNLELDDEIDFNKEIEVLKKELLDLEETEKKFERRGEKIESYLAKLEKWNKYVQIKTKMDEIINEENLILRGISKAEIFLKKINDAEAISLEQTIEMINSDVTEYVQNFFGDNFTIFLKNYRENKKGEQKLGIDICVTKDGESIGLESLSGGEYDRVCLAFFLAFNNVSRSNIIMLDESLSSIHAEMVEDIVIFIKERLRNKLVMFTLHQCNTGLFDTMINVEELRN